MVLEYDNQEVFDISELNEYDANVFFCITNVYCPKN